MVVLLRGAHPAAVRPLVETLLEGHAPGDPEAPCVRVCFLPHELLDAPVGARVVLVGAEREPEWLNIHRPVVWERELVLLLWVEDGELEHLRRNAPDFLDWVSHRIEVPWFAPERAMADLVRAQLVGTTWIAIAGAELVAMCAEGRREIDASRGYDNLASTMEDGDVLIRGLENDNDLWRLLIAHAEVRWCHQVVLVEPRVLPPLVWVVDARLEDWEQGAHRLESLGVEHPRLVAALESRPERTPFASALAIDDAHMELLGRVAREQVDDATVRLARALGLDDVAEGLGPVMWSDAEITPELIERGLRGGLRDSRALWDYVRSTVEKEVIDMLARQREELSLLQEIIPAVLEDFLSEDHRALRAWDPATEPSFERYLRRLAERRARVALLLRTRSMERRAQASLPSSAEPVAEQGAELRAQWEQVLKALTDQERELVDDRYIREMSIDEIAKKHELSGAAIKIRLTRVRRKLSAALKEASRRS